MTPEIFFENFEHLVEAPGGVGKLRELALAMALRGRYSSPEPDDCSVDDLLSEVDMRREELISKRETRRGKPLPSPEDGEEPFEIPRYWKWVRLGESLSTTPEIESLA